MPLLDRLGNYPKRGVTPVKSRSLRAFSDKLLDPADDPRRADSGLRVPVERPGLLRSWRGVGCAGRDHRRNRPRKGPELNTVEIANRRKPWYLVGKRSLRCTVHHRRRQPFRCHRLLLEDHAAVLAFSPAPRIGERSDRNHPRHLAAGAKVFQARCLGHHRPADRRIPGKHPRLPAPGIVPLPATRSPFTATFAGCADPLGFCLYKTVSRSTLLSNTDLFHEDEGTGKALVSSPDWEQPTRCSSPKWMPSGAAIGSSARTCGATGDPQGSSGQSARSWTASATTWQHYWTTLASSES